VDQLIPTTEDHTATSLDVPDSEHVAYEQEVEGEGAQPLPARPTRKDAFTALSVLDTVISASDADERIVKAMDDIQDFVSKIYRQSLKQRSIDSYFKKQLPNVKFRQVNCSRACVYVLSVLNFSSSCDNISFYLF
jgi:hypothetical protein